MLFPSEGEGEGEGEGGERKKQIRVSLFSVQFLRYLIGCLFFREKIGREMCKIWSGISWRHFFVLSVALNVGFISRIFYGGESSRQEPKHRGTFMADVSQRAAHVSKGYLGDWSTAPPNRCEIEVEDDGKVINVDHGDPTMYERFWHQMGDKTTVVIFGWQSVSYFSDIGNLCWFLEPEFANQIVRLHKLVGNAITENRHIVVGTGSSQLLQAALYALSPADASEPMNVVSAAPFYSSYPLITNYLKSGLYKWAGDACDFKKDEPYIEFVTSPNNPDGFTRQPVVNRSQGILVHDFAYYWPQYTPISSPADHDLMLFTVSKSTGHAGMRIGWALVKDEEVAKKMTKFIELNTIGVSKDSQLRAARILQAISDSYEEVGSFKEDAFFEFGHRLMAERWRRLRLAVKQSGLFSLPDFLPESCTFFGRVFASQPAFAWLECKTEVEDCETFLRHHKIQTRGGKHFGVSPKYVRVSVVDRDENFDRLIQRLSMISL